MNEETTQLAKLNVARNALKEAKSIQEILDIKSVGEAVAYYAKKKKLTVEIRQEAEIFVLEAEVKFGEKMAELEKSKGGEHTKTTSSKNEPVGNKIPTLAEMGISKKDSANSQKLAKNKDKVAEIVKEKKEKKEPISKAAILKEISPEPKRRNTAVQASFNVMTDTFTKHVAKVQKDLDRFTPTAFAGFISNDLNEMVRVLESWKNPTLECHTCKGTGSYKQTGTVLTCDRCIGGKVGLSLFMVKGK